MTLDLVARYNEMMQPAPTEVIVKIHSLRMEQDTPNIYLEHVGIPQNSPRIAWHTSGDIRVSITITDQDMNKFIHALLNTNNKIDIYGDCGTEDIQGIIFRDIRIETLDNSNQTECLWNVRFTTPNVEYHPL